MHLLSFRRAILASLRTEPTVHPPSHTLRRARRASVRATLKLNEQSARALPLAGLTNEPQSNSARTERKCMCTFRINEEEEDANSFRNPRSDYGDTNGDVASPKTNAS